MAAEKLYPKIRFFSDGIGVGSTTMRLSNIPKNLSSQAAYVAGTVVTAYNFLTNSMVNATPAETEYSSEYLCPGDRKTFHFEAPNGTPYRVVISDAPALQAAMNEMSKGKLQLPTLTSLLTERLEFLPRFCQSNITVDYNQTYSGVEYLLPVPYSSQACNISAFSYPENMLRDSTFEKCLTNSLDQIGKLWGFGFGTLAFKHMAQNQNAEPINLTIPATIFFTTIAVGAASCCFFALHSPQTAQTAPPQPQGGINHDKLEKINFNADNIPPHFICRITQNIMDDPVTAADGLNYERAAIEHWFSVSPQKRSLRDNLPLKNTILTPNSALKKEIEGFVKNREKQARRSNPSTSTPRPGSDNN